MTIQTHGPSAATLQPALRRLDLRLRLAVESFRSQAEERARDPYRGLYLSEADIDELLAGVPPATAARRLLDEPPAAVGPRFARLAELFGLDPFEQEALLVCLAPELDLRYERLFGYLQDDVTRRRPTVDLILRLLCPSLDEHLAAREALGPGGRLLSEGLLALADESAAQAPLLARPLRPDERLVEYLLGSDRPDPRLTPFAELFPPSAAPESTALPAELAASLPRLLQAGADTAPRRGPIVYLHGASSAQRRTAARAACQAAGRPLLLLDLAALAAGGRPEHGLALAAREALLQNAVLGVDGFDRLLVETGDLLPVRRALARLLERRPAPTLLLGEARWEPATWFHDAIAVRVELRPLPIAARAQVWREQLDGQVPPEEVANLASRFRLEGEEVRAVLAAAQSRAAWRGERQPGPEDVRASARAIAAPDLEGLARRVDCRYSWEDIVLPADSLAQLREICGRLRHQETVLERWGYGRKHARRAGLTALFAGQPGTGKTMAAEIVAGELGLDLFRIDLSAVVSKYIGETEKNLERIFRAADRGDAVLLFDEADALFGKRSEVKDAHDRYANVEIAYLLQRLEAYQGLAILTTNLRGNLDEAFLRRLDFVIEFPMPEEPERLAILRRALPPEAPLAEDVDLAFLARKFKLAGGHLRNIALAAAYLAASEGGPIGMKHLVRATRREFQKLGKLVAETDFERYYELLKEE